MRSTRGRLPYGARECAGPLTLPGMATRKAHAQWRGNLAEGDGTMALGSGAFDGPFTSKSRFEEGSGTNPEELIGAAHAGCFTMQLSHILSEEGHVPDEVRTEASVHLRRDDSGPRIARIDLRTTGRVPGIDQDTFASFAEKAKDGCIVSRALAGVDEMTVEATLEG